MDAAYDTDFYAWTQDQARRLRDAAAARTNLPLDFENLAEEVSDLGSNKADAAHSALVRILEHLLKLEYSPATYPRRGWRRSVLVHRDRLNRILAKSGSIARHLDLNRAFTLALKLAAKELWPDRVPGPGLLPAECPYGLQQILDEDWWPERNQGTRGPQ